MTQQRHRKIRQAELLAIREVGKVITENIRLNLFKSQTDKDDRERSKRDGGGEREGGREGERERENSNSKPLILKDNRIRSIWTYLAVTPC